MAIQPEPGYEFAVFFYKKAREIIVYGPDGEFVPGVPLEAKGNTLDKVYKLDTLHVAHIAGHSPCCVVWDGQKYCWCW